VLFHQDLAVVRAAFKYWSEEPHPHGMDAMRPYLDILSFVPCFALEPDQLRRRFDSVAVRYVICEKVVERIANTTLFVDADNVSTASGNNPIATVFLSPVREFDRT
jgi:hypothetical protein